MANNNNEIVDNHKLAEDVSSKINYTMLRHFLVKPLDPVMVKKEFSKPVDTKEETVDKNGIKAVDYEKVETEVKEVESDYSKGVVLKVPHTYSVQLEHDTYAPMDIKVGDVVIYKATCAQYFDLCKDSQLIDIYQIVAVEK